MHRNTIVLTVLLMFAAQAIAHGPSIELSGLKATGTAEGIFLEAQLDPPDGGATLIAVSTPFGSAIFESRDSRGYLATERIPITHEQRTLGVATAYRVRLPEIASREGTMPVTLLFSGGSIIRSEAELAVGSTSYRSWAGAGAAGALLLALLAVKLGKGNKNALRRSDG